MSSSERETHVHIESRPDADLVHVPWNVYVNGVPVLLAEGGLEIEQGFDQATVVVLKILPKTVTFGGPVQPKPPSPPPTRAELVDMVLNSSVGGKA